MSCPWLDREKKELEKMEKYEPLCFELSRKVPRIQDRPADCDHRRTGRIVQRS